MTDAAGASDGVVAEGATGAVDAETLGFDMASSEFLRDPYTAYARVRERAPLVRLSVPAHPRGRVFVVTRYDDVKAVIADRRFSSDGRALYPPPEGAPEPSMLSLDPPAHTRLRARVARDFTPKRVGALEEAVRDIVAERLHAALARGTFDLIADLALPVPVMVICELLGIPEADRAQLATWSQEFIDTSGIGNASADAQARNAAANEALFGYLGGFVRMRQQHPDEALVSALLRPSDDHDDLSFEEVVSMCMLLLVAGHETTVNLVGNGVRTLLAHRDQWRALVDDPGLAPSVVEEALRFEPPVQRSTFRISCERLELAGGVLGQGEQVLACIAAANRDPAAFPDPDRFDVARDAKGHLSFGRGVHFCLGAPLARLEGRLVFEALAAAAPELRAAGPDDAWRPSTLFRGLERLPVSAG